MSSEDFAPHPGAPDDLDDQVQRVVVAVPVVDLVDRVIPRGPVRQWVLALSFTLRYQLAFDAKLTAAVPDVFIRSVFAWLRRAAAREGIADAPCGAITVIQRFGSAVNANVHFHSLVLDGVFSRPAPGAAPVFHPLPAPTDEEIAQIMEQIHDRVTRLQRRCLEGFSLHANVGLEARAREQLEHLCRYLLRPPLALDRLTKSTKGQLVYQLPHPRRNRATHLLLDPLELIEKLCALIPPPRFHLLRFHAVLAPRAQLRSAVVPLSSRDAEFCGGQAQRPSPPEPRSSPSSGAGRLSWVP